MLAALDPHSSYLLAPSSSYLNVRFNVKEVQYRGEFGVLGLDVTLEGGLIKVVTLLDDTPAAKAGIMPNDIITHIDDAPVQGMTLNHAVEKMRGQVNTKAKLTIMRKGVDRPIEVSFTPEVTRDPVVRSRLEGNDVGYIRISEFGVNTTESLRSAIKVVNIEAGARLKGFIIDLRNNPGGPLDEAIMASDAFLEKGEIVLTRGKGDETFSARPGDLTDQKPIIVLINGGTVGASEIMVGALQDHRRATILGTRSFGMGTVQTVFQLGPGKGALRLTTARYFTPSGRSPQAKGIAPDIEVVQDILEVITGRTTRGESLLRGHLKGEGEEETGSESYVPPNPRDDKALQTAIDLIRGVQKNSAYPPWVRRTP
jgi:carboxyl-terminal processing protease